jgi:modulator of FtsH protease
VTAYDPSEWSDLFVAVAGASAALLGLLFVAVSINLERILGFEGLPERALETLLLLLGVLVAAIAGLMPGQSATALGLELLGIGLAMGAITLRLPLRAVAGDGSEPLAWRLDRYILRLSGIVPIVIGGLLLALEAGGGLYWIAAGIVFAICGAVANAWVLLVEILR